MPDITLLPAISRFFGITVDELLCAEKLDEEALYRDFETRAEELFRTGERGERHLAVWREAYRQLPNDPRVQEHLMAAYFDADKVKYVKEITELAVLLLRSGDSYFRGQAIRLAAVSHAASRDTQGAEKWASRAGWAMHSRERIEAEFTCGEELLADVRSYAFHTLDGLFYMSVRLAQDGILCRSEGEELLGTVAKIFEEVYKNDGAGFETMRQIFNLHSLAADLSEEEQPARLHLERACGLALKMRGVRAHELKTPLLKGLSVQPAPGDGLETARFMIGDMKTSPAAQRWSGRDWYKEIVRTLEAALES